MIKRLGTNAYFLELPADIQYFSPIFYVDDLSEYYGHDKESCQTTVSADLPCSSKPRDVIEDILDDKWYCALARRGGYQKFLVKWMHCTLMSDCCWLKADEVQRLNPDLYEYYQSKHPSDSSFSGRRELMEPRLFRV